MKSSTTWAETPRRPIDRASRWERFGRPALAGIAAAAVAIATSELLAGLIAGAPSLVIAIGNQVIALQPPGAKELAVSLFGLNDKLALNVAVLFAAGGIAAVAGILADRRFWYGASILIAVGIAAAVVAAFQPLTPVLLAGLTALAAVTAGLVALRWLLRLSRPTPGQEATMPDWSRRRFVIASAGTIGAAIAVGGAGRLLLDEQPNSGVVHSTRLPEPLQALPALHPDQSLAAPGITPLVVPSEDFYRIDTALLVPRVDVRTWSLDIEGMVDRPLSFSYDDLLDLPLYEQYVTIACVSNRVGGNLVGNALWTGVRLKEILELAGIQAGATQIIGRSVDGFTAGFPTDWAVASEREPLVAIGMNREPLPVEHGFPARLIVPGLYGYVSATKWLSSIELTTREAVDGYWVPLGWAKDAPILTQSRIDVPSSRSRVAAGPTQIAGVAWAPDRGISRVEVRIDDGDWQTVRMSVPISDATWVQWVQGWTATPGQHSIEVRATDSMGDVQTDQVSEPAPDGARGHHRILVTVA